MMADVPQVRSQGAIDLEYESDGKRSDVFLGKGLCWVSLAYLTHYVVYQLVHQTSQRNPGQHFFPRKIELRWVRCWQGSLYKAEVTYKFLCVEHRVC